MQNEKKVEELKINDVLPNRFQPRIKFDEDSINELAISIKKYGVIQPIVVRQIGDKYEIIAGERRYKASVIAGKETIPAIISNLSDKDSVEIALIENVQREDLTPIEKAVSYKKILDMGYMSQEDLAQKIGKSQSSIANTLRLLGLSDDVQEALLENKISERHARSLLKIKSDKDQVKMLNKIIDERLTVRKTDEEIDKMLNDIDNTLPTEETEEIVSIPDTAPVDPGFMDIDKIENTAKDIYEPEKPVANVDNLMKADEKMQPTNPEESDILIPGKFFNFFDDSDKSVNPLNEFAFDNYVDQTKQEIPDPFVVPTVEPITPVYEEVSMAPVMPEIPAVEPITPVCEEVPVAPVMPEIPAVEPITPVYEEAPMAPVMPEIPAVEPITPVYEEVPVAPVMPEIPAVEPITPVYKEAPVVPVMPEIPAVEPITPVYDDIPNTPTIEEKVSPVAPIQDANMSHNIKTAVSTIRDCANTLERYGFIIDVEEIDFEDSYQVIFKIEK